MCKKRCVPTRTTDDANNDTNMNVHGLGKDRCWIHAPGWNKKMAPLNQLPKKEDKPTSFTAEAKLQCEICYILNR